MFILETSDGNFVEEYATYAEALEDMLLIMEQDEYNGELVEYKITEV